MNRLLLDRRAALALIGAAGVGAGLTLRNGRVQLPEETTLLLVDERAEEAAKNLAVGNPSVRILPIREDILRHWRDGLGASVLDERGKVVALARWDHTLTLEGLAREARRKTISHKLPGGLFRTEFL